MIIKPSITFLHSDADQQLIGRTEGILLGMTDNASYPAPTPTLAVLTTAKDEFATAVANALDGGKTLTAIKNAKREILVALLRQLASYLQAACNGDLTALMSSGFPIQKPQRQPIGTLPAPTSLTVTFGPRTGELQATASPVVGAVIYSWRVSTAAAPNEIVQTVQTTAARNVFTGLTPGVVYNIQANAVGTAGPSNWSGPARLMAVWGWKLKFPLRLLVAATSSRGKQLSRLVLFAQVAVVHDRRAWRFFSEADAPTSQPHGVLMR
jgi:hypothetical protein